MSDPQKKSENEGCLVLIGIIALSSGIGMLTKEGWGWITFGVIILGLFARKYWKS